MFKSKQQAPVGETVFFMDEELSKDSQAQKSGDQPRSSTLSFNHKRVGSESEHDKELPEVSAPLDIIPKVSKSTTEKQSFTTHRFYSSFSYRREKEEKAALAAQEHLRKYREELERNALSLSAPQPPMSSTSQQPSKVESVLGLKQANLSSQNQFSFHRSRSNTAPTEVGRTVIADPEINGMMFDMDM